MRGVEATTTSFSNEKREKLVKFLGAVVAVTLIVAVASGVANGTGEAEKRQAFWKGKDGASKKKAEWEKEIFESTGIRVKVVDMHDFEPDVIKKVAGDVSSVTYSNFALKFIAANAYLSGANGNGAKLVDRGTVGSTEKWDIEFVAAGDGYTLVENRGVSGKCAEMEGDGDVRLDSCGGTNTQFILCRVSENEDPASSYSANQYLLYRFSNKKRFVIMKTNGDVSEASDARELGLFRVEKQ